MLYGRTHEPSFSKPVTNQPCFSQVRPCGVPSARSQSQRSSSRTSLAPADAAACCDRRDAIRGMGTTSGPAWADEWFNDATAVSEQREPMPEGDTRVSGRPRASAA